MCKKCQYLKAHPNGTYCSISNSEYCIKDLSFEDIKKEIIKQKLCIRKLGYTYERVCEEAEADCELCRQIIENIDLTEAK